MNSLHIPQVTGPFKCERLACTKLATHKYHWPEQDAMYICETHLPNLKRIAEGLSLHLVIEPLDPFVEDALSDLDKEITSTYRVWYLLKNFLKLEDGVFCFPDGDVWDLTSDECPLDLRIGKKTWVKKIVEDDEPGDYIPEDPRPGDST